MRNNLYDALLEIAEHEIDGMSYEEALHYLDNDAIPGLGGVSELVAYSDTERFAKEYHDEIVEALEDAGVKKAMSLNDMAWAAWELLIYGNGEQVLNDLGVEPDED